jgi:hypothetical protein
MFLCAFLSFMSFYSSSTYRSFLFLLFFYRCLFTETFFLLLYMYLKVIIFLYSSFSYASSSYFSFIPFSFLPSASSCYSSYLYLLSVMPSAAAAPVTDYTRLFASLSPRSDMCSSNQTQFLLSHKCRARATHEPTSSTNQRNIVLTQWYERLFLNKWELY